MADQTIVIVDDEPQTVDMFEMFLTLKGYAVQSAYDGEDGLRLIRDVHPAVVLLDLMMPGMDGYAVCTHLRADPALATIPVVIVTARTEVSAVRRAEEVGADSYLIKPVRFPALIGEIERVLVEQRNIWASPGLMR